MIVETSGAALPYDTLLHFWREPVRDWFEDDASLVVVNAEQVIEGRDLVGTFEDQVASADLLVVNKIDLVSPADVERIDDAAIEDLEVGELRERRGRGEPQVSTPAQPQGQLDGLVGVDKQQRIERDAGGSASATTVVATVASAPANARHRRTLSVSLIDTDSSLPGPNKFVR